MGLRVPAASMKWQEKTANDIGATTMTTVRPRRPTLPPAAEVIPLVKTGLLVKAARKKYTRQGGAPGGRNPRLALPHENTRQGGSPGGRNPRLALPHNELPSDRGTTGGIISPPPRALDNIDNGTPPVPRAPEDTTGPPANHQESEAAASSAADAASKMAAATPSAQRRQTRGWPVLILESEAAASSAADAASKMVAATPTARSRRDPGVARALPRGSRGIRRQAHQNQDWPRTNSSRRHVTQKTSSRLPVSRSPSQQAHIIRAGGDGGHPLQQAQRGHVGDLQQAQRGHAGDGSSQQEHPGLPFLFAASPPLWAGGDEEPPTSAGPLPMDRY